MWPEHEKTQELLGGIRSGNGDAVNHLLERHRDAVRRLVQMRLDARVQRRVDVSDVVQDVFVEAHRRLAEFVETSPMPFHLWLRQIAQDRIIDAHRRHRASAKRSVDREQAMHVPAGMDRSSIELAAQLVDPELTPAAAATQQEMAQRVEAAIAELPEQDAEIIVMRHYEHLSNQEIAVALGLTEPAASMRYLRAVRRLREVLGGDVSQAGQS
jgi:RNA polymerase sigma-70 factor (ECF subfamily)